MTSNSVLLITVDCLRSDHIGCYGYDRPTTPNIDQLAQQGVAFDGYSNCPGTRWALQTIHTGAYHGQFDGVGIPSDITSLASHFQNEDYSTGGFAINGFLTSDYGYNKGFDTFLDVKYFDERDRREKEEIIKNTLPDLMIERFIRPIHNNIRKYINRGQFRPSLVDSDVVDEAIEWIEAQSGDWFAWVHLMDAHTPYARWEDHLHELRGDTDIEHVINPHNVEDNLSEPIIDAYDSGIRSADEQIGRLLNYISNNSTVLITGDHGEEFGKYGEFHSASLFSSMTQVPFLLRSPDLDYNTTGRIQEKAEHIDIAPTLVELAGVSDNWRGTSLLTPSNERDDREIWHQVSDYVGVQKNNWKYIEGINGFPVGLFETGYGEDDRWVKTTDHRELFENMKSYIEEYKKYCRENYKGRGVNTDITEADISEEVKSNLQDLGYRR